jgi:hypothetical protein
LYDSHDVYADQKSFDSYEWKRLGEIYKNGEVFVGKIEPNDIN